MEEEREGGRGRKKLPPMSKRIREERYGPGWETVSPVVSPVKWDRKERLFASINTGRKEIVWPVEGEGGKESEGNESKETSSEIFKMTPVKI